MYIPPLNGQATAANSQPVVLASDKVVNIGSGDAAIGARADGHLKTIGDPTTLLFDTFETLDTTNTWTIGGTTSPTGSAGLLTFNAGTAASGSSYAESKPKFIPSAQGFLQNSWLVTLAAAAETNNKRFWGIGVLAGTPTAAIPVANGVVFEAEHTTGALFGAVYSNSVRTQSVALTRPTDGTVHRYLIYYRASRVYFEIDNVQVGSLPFPNPQVQNLGIISGSVNHTTGPGVAATLNATLASAADTGKNSHKVSDGIYPWRFQTIKPASTAASATDLPAVVALHPSSPTPNFAAAQAVTGTFWQATQPVSISSAPTIVTSSAPATSGGLTTFHLVSAATTNATVVKASAGQLFGYYIYNSNAAARKITFHNAATTPTAGAGTFFTIIIPPTSGANVEYSNGIQFSTGIAITTTTDLTDAGTTAVALNDLNINLFYK